ncbi:CHAT domain-containing protein [Bradyrhizobium guangzhouense]|nr:CHAT domain-containing protein [Bradyrhizobium guangzhouense]
MAIHHLGNARDGQRVGHLGHAARSRLLARQGSGPRLDGQEACESRRAQHHRRPDRSQALRQPCLFPVRRRRFSDGSRRDEVHRSRAQSECTRWIWLQRPPKGPDHHRAPRTSTCSKTSSLMPSGFAIAWEAGASAQVELFSPDLDGAAADNDYRFKFSPPMRRTLRPPITGLQLGDRELGPIVDRLNKLGEALDARRQPDGTAAAPAAAGNAILAKAQEAGTLLHTLIIPSDVQMELGSENLFLEIGIDEALLEFPWELLHDGTDFFGLTHSIGRFVNVSKATIPSQNRPEPIGIKPLSVLLISVPTPQPRQTATGNLIYQTLPGAVQETDEITRAITALGSDAELDVLSGRGATWTAVAMALKSKRYHIVHYSGHAYFDNQKPMNSSLVLDDEDMATGAIKQFCKQPPVLFFINGCESGVGRGTGSAWKNRYDIFGLARAFLDTGAYLLGSRHQVGDGGAAMFAKSFYAQVLNEKPIGTAVREARRACKTAGDFVWASYVYYGDPRIRFCKVGNPRPGG